MTIQQIVRSVHNHSLNKGFWANQSDTNTKLAALSYINFDLCTASYKFSEDVWMLNKQDYIDKIMAESIEFNDNYEEYVLGSVDWHLMQAFLKLCDFSGAYHFGYNSKIEKAYHDELMNGQNKEITNIVTELFMISHTVSSIHFEPFAGKKVGECLARIERILKQLDFNVFVMISQEFKYQGIELI